MSIPLVATNDCHYLNIEHAEAHNVLLCIQTGKTIEDTDRMSMATDQFYVRSPEEMQALFAETPEALANTVRIAERCNLTFEFASFCFLNSKSKIRKKPWKIIWIARQRKGWRSSCRSS